MKLLSKKNTYFTEILFFLLMFSFFISYIPLFNLNYFFLILVVQLSIFISLFQLIRRKIPFVLVLKTKSFLHPVLLITCIFFLNILLGVWFYSYSEILNISHNDAVIILSHFVFFLLLSIKLIGLQSVNKRLTAIFGAGVAGQQLLMELNQKANTSVLFFIDDSKEISSKVGGINVFSRKVFTENLYRAVDHVYVAIPTIKPNQLNSLIRSLEGLGIGVRKLPSLNEIPTGKASVQLMSSIDEVDLIGRVTVKPDSNLLQKNILNKVVLVSGAGGSIGSAICKEIIKHSPKELVIFDVSEFGLYDIDRILGNSIGEVSNIKISTEIGSIQSLSRLKSLFKKYDIDTVYHAAAYKHVPIVELNLAEGYKNNVNGTKNLVSVAVQNNVNNFVLISSDKAVRPTNFMGVTKRLCELVCQSYSNNESGTVISMVRFGNVIGSSGSVVPLFKNQIAAGGPVTVTHPDITRYFMTVEEASELVIQASGLSKGGEIFVLDMGEPIKILNIAKRMISLAGKKPCFSTKDISPKNILIEYTGLRPGEKMYEELFIENSSFPTSHPQINKCDEISINIDEIETVFKKLIDALEDNVDSTLIKEIINELPVSYEPNID